PSLQSGFLLQLPYHFRPLSSIVFLASAGGRSRPKFYLRHRRGPCDFVSNNTTARLGGGHCPPAGGAPSGGQVAPMALSVKLPRHTRLAAGNPRLWPS